MPGTDDPRLVAALAAIDAANAEDPERLAVDGHYRPKELVHAERVTHWLHRLVAEPSPAQVLAARAHHLRRWELPRTGYPAGRSGYLRWRADQKKRHVAAVGDLLRSAGFADEVTARVGEIVAKRGLGSDPEVQAHEDALCLVFLELQYDDLAAQLGDERTVEVLRKTLPKMSPAAVELAAGLDLSDHGRALLTRAIAEPGRGSTR